MKHLIDQRTKDFCSIIKFPFDFCRKYSILEFETKFVIIRHELNEIYKFQNRQADFNCQNFADSQGIDFHYECTICHCKEIFAADK